MINHAHHGMGPLKMPKCEGMKRCVMKMGEDTVEGINRMFSVRRLCVNLFNKRIDLFQTGTRIQSIYFSQRMDFKQWTCIFSNCRALRY